MRRSNRCMLSLMGVALALPLLAHAEEWKLAKQEDGVNVYLSEVPGSQFKAYRGVVTIHAPIEKIEALQNDVAGSCRWIHECKEQKLLRRGAEGEAWTHSYFNTPWPVTPRDSVIHVTTEHGADGSQTRHLEGVPKEIPEENGYVRVAKVDGFWRLTPKSDGVEVTYQVHTEPGGSVPSWLANKFVVEAPLNTLKALRERAEQ